jgi:hypothetical protein
MVVSEYKSIFVCLRRILIYAEAPKPALAEKLSG